MAKRPTRYVRLATNAAPGMIVEPSAGYLQGGLPVDRRPPAQWFNYFFNNIGGWFDYLRTYSLTNWTQRAITVAIADPGPGFFDAAFIATDVESEDTAVRARIAIAGVDSGGDLHVYVSHRGVGWDEVSNFVDASLGPIRGLKFHGGIWHLWTGTNLLYTAADNGSASALTVGGSTDWSDAGEADVKDIAYDSLHGNRWLLATDTTWEKSTDGITWTAASVTGTAGGPAQGIVWDGARFVTLRGGGEVWTTPDLDTPLTLAATIATGNFHKICAGEGKLFAYQRFLNGTSTMFVSSDHGVNWAPVVLPSDMKFITNVLYSDGQWLATTQQFPYLWTSNDLVNWDRGYVQLPHNLTGFALIGAAAAQRSMLLLGPLGASIFQSTAAHDAANGDYTTFTTPVARSDAAYLQGREIADIAPAHGQVPAWNSSTQRYEPASAGVSIGDPNLFEADYDLSAGAHDFTDDPNWMSTAFPDSETGEGSSAVLGDGTDVPYFYAIHPANFGGLDRTAGGRMRLTLGGVGNSTWPGNNDTPAIVYPLPRAQRIELEFTLYLAATALNNGNFAGFTLCRNGNTSGALEVICRVDIQATGAASADETVSLWNHVYSANAVNGYVVSSTFSRHYRVVLDGPNLAVYGGAIGSPAANTLIHGRSNVARGLSRNDVCLSFCVASSGVVSAPLYVEHGPLHWEGTKS